MCIQLTMFKYFINIFTNFGTNYQIIINWYNLHSSPVVCVLSLQSITTFQIFANLRFFKMVLYG